MLHPFWLEFQSWPVCGDSGAAPTGGPLRGTGRRIVANQVHPGSVCTCVARKFKERRLAPRRHGQVGVDDVLIGSQPNCIVHHLGYNFVGATRADSLDGEAVEFDDGLILRRELNLTRRVKQLTQFEVAAA